MPVTSVVSGCDPAPVLEPADHDLDAVASFVAAAVEAGFLPAALSAKGANPYPLVFQPFSIPIGIIPPISQKPFCLWHVAQQGRSAGVIAHLACGHEELQRPSLGIGDGMELGVQAAFRALDGPSAPPFFTRRLEAVRCAFR